MCKKKHCVSSTRSNGCIRSSGSELRKYEELWSLEVTNPRTQEQINVVDPATWQARLQTMTGAL
jgi:hypothetical protein